jgi:uncharacterized membrane protein YidH (DUF202 family)
MTDAPGHSPAAERRVLLDGGLQMERTALSWQRTSCALVVIAVVGIRFSAMTNQWLLVALESVIALSAAALFVRCICRPASTHRDLAILQTGRVHLTHSAGVPMLMLTVIVSLMGLTALVVAMSMSPLR